jgi:hypothetical protein
MPVNEARLRDLGHILPAPLVVPAGTGYPFPALHVIGARCVISGHGSQAADGTISGPFGRVLGMVNAIPCFRNHPAVINGFSELILDVFGAQTGGHARSAIGVSGLPENYAVEVEAEMEVHP